ncbi:acyltransferase [Enterobacter roggenkampii]|uniref:acyltransferase n=1 Tax=Enterobacter roggenkampii TaxID=1812935 RepID=UPI001C7018BF|nr:acyltransferase [Enterobacter roggenkampii]MBW9393714.1 acyltransferase [Enterobacter roggenkampii]
MGILSVRQINELGFASVGENCRLSDKAAYYNCKEIHIGNNVRIDDFCVLSAGDGGIYLGDFIHIAVYSSLIGAGRISLDNFVNISSRVSIYSSSDDYSGISMTNPMVPEEFTNVTRAPVNLGKHVIIGSGSVVLPGVNISDGCAIGALSLVTTDCEDFFIYAGIPAKKIKERGKGLLDLENKFCNKYGYK